MDEPHFYEEEPEDLYEQEQPPEELTRLEFEAPAPEAPLASTVPDAVSRAEVGFSVRDPSEAHVRGGCRDCRCLSVNQAWRDAFSVHLCHQCKTQYELISKGNAKEQYCLTDGDMKRLGSVSKANPQRKEWSAMKLYLLEQVEAIAVRKYGSLDNLELHHEQQQMAKTKKHITKRKEESQKLTQGDARLARIRQKIETAEESTVSGPVVTDTVREGKLERKYACGVSVRVELI